MAGEISVGGPGARRARACAIVAGTVLAIAGLLSYGAGTAAAVTGRVGPVDVSVSPTSSVTDGRTVDIRADVPAGISLYQIRAHLCRPGPNVRTDFDFGFQGKRCSNVAVGSGDVEKTVEYGSGVRSGGLTSFRVGAGTVRWVNELGYPQTLDCGLGRPCDLVVRLEITDQAVFFTAPLCYGTGCPAEAPSPSPSPSPSSSFSSSTTTSAPRTAALPKSGAAAGRSAPSATTGTRGSAPGSGRRVNGARASAAGSAGPRAIASGAPPQPAGSSGRGLSERARVLLSGAAGAVAGAWIVSVYLRGGGWIAFGVSTLRRRSRRTRTA